MSKAYEVKASQAKIGEGAPLQTGFNFALGSRRKANGSNFGFPAPVTRFVVWGTALLAPSTALADCGSPPSAPWWWGAVLTPILTGAFGVAVGYVAIGFDVKKSSNQELIKKRIALYDQISPSLNELYCFLLARGNWQSLTPRGMIDRKRELDKIFFIYGRLFSSDTVVLYHTFIHACFKTFTGAGRDAKLRADMGYLFRQRGQIWKNEWDEHIAPSNDATDPKIIAQYYGELMDQLSVEIGARQRPMPAWFSNLFGRRGAGRLSGG